MTNLSSDWKLLAFTNIVMHKKFLNYFKVIYLINTILDKIINIYK